MGCSCIKAPRTPDDAGTVQTPSAIKPVKEDVPPNPSDAPKVLVPDQVDVQTDVNLGDGLAAFEQLLPHSPPTDNDHEVSAWAWGHGSAFSSSSSDATLTPVKLDAKNRSVHALATGWNRSLVVASSGALWAAGSNANSCLFEDRPEGSQELAKVDLLELDGQQVEAAALGKDHIVTVLEAGERVLSWGRNTCGQLGHSSKADKNFAPKAVVFPSSRTQVHKVACGEAHTLILTVEGSIFAFGDGSAGQLGLGHDKGASTATLVDAGDIMAVPIRSVCAGAQHSMAMSFSGEVFAWGCAEHGRLGLGSGLARTAPVLEACRLRELPRPAEVVSAGGQHSAVILEGHECFFAGNNQFGQLGKSPQSTKQSSSFQAIAGSYRAVALGGDHSLLLGCDGHVYSCGRSHRGQLGAGKVTDGFSSELRRVAIPRGQEVLAMASGHDHSIVLTRGRQPKEQSQVSPPVQQLMTSDVPSAARTAPEKMDFEEVPDLPVEAGICAGARFTEMQMEDLNNACLPNPGSPASATSSAATRPGFVDHLSSLFASPTSLNASFGIPGVRQARLDSEALVEAFDKFWELESWTDKQRSQLRSAAAQGLERWAGDVKVSGKAPRLTHRDQVRGLAVLLLSPMIKDIDQSSDAYDLMCKLVGLTSSLPDSGRAALTELVAEDLMAVLKNVVVKRVRGFCDAAVRKAMKGPYGNQGNDRMPPEVWQGLIVLDLLSHANDLIQGKLQKEVLVAGAQAGGQDTFRRTVSRISGNSSSGIPGLGSRGHMPDANQESDLPIRGGAFWRPEAPVPAAHFELESLVEGTLPAEKEFLLFVKNASAEVPSFETLLKLRPDDPKAQSFVAHRRLVPANFLRRVLLVENTFRQNLQAQQNFQEFLQGALQGGGFNIGPNGSLNLNLDTSKFVLPIKVRRDHLLEDTLQVLQDAAPADLKKPLRVTFVGEEGQDAGGVSREFFKLLGEQLFSLKSGLFDKAIADDARVLWFDRNSQCESVDYWLLGVALGLSVYNGSNGLDAQFPVCIFKKLMEEPVQLEDLAEICPAVASSFRTLLSWSAPEGMSSKDAEEFFVSTFCLDFSISVEDSGKTVIKELKPEGKDINVTPTSRSEFVELYCQWVLVESVTAVFEPFRKGFARVCGSPLLQAFTGLELSRIVMGDTDLELEHLQPKAKYEGYTAASAVVVWLWSLLKELDKNQRKCFLSFVTGSDRAPVGGLSELQLIIQKAGAATVEAGRIGEGGKVEMLRLPTAHTCFNTLLLPEYSSQEQLGTALRMAIENTEGFGLE